MPWHEFFVSSWCAHPDLVPDEVIMVVPEPEREQDGGLPLYLRPHEITHDDVPALRYLVRIRLIEFQDWHTPPLSSSNDDFHVFEEDDSDDSNHNRHHPGFGGGGGGSRSRTSRFAGQEEPRLGPGYGASFWVRESRTTILVGAVQCPVKSADVAIPCCPMVSGFYGTPGARGDAFMVAVDEFVNQGAITGSPSSVRTSRVDPMEDEAALSTPRPCRIVCDRRAAHSIDIWPRRPRSLPTLGRGFVGTALEMDMEMLCNRPTIGPTIADDGPFLGHAHSAQDEPWSFMILDLEADFAWPRTKVVEHDESDPLPPPCSSPPNVAEVGVAFRELSSTGSAG